MFTQEERLEIVGSLKMVDEVFVEESLEKKRDYIVEHGADVLVMGDDWAGKFDWVSDVRVVYLPRRSVSTTGLIEHIATISVLLTCQGDARGLVEGEAPREAG